MNDDQIRENMKYARGWAANLPVRPPFISFRFCEDAKQRKNQLFLIAFQPPKSYPLGNYAVYIPMYLDLVNFTQEIQKVWPSFRDLAFKCKEDLEKTENKLQHKNKTLASPQFKSMSEIAIEMEKKASKLELERVS